MYWPTGSPPLNRSVAVVAPITATGEADETSLSVKNAPSATVQLRTVAQAGVVPVTDVFVFVPPTMTWARPVSSGSIAAASGTAPAAWSALTSSRVRVVAPPPAPRTIPDETPPGETRTRFVPRPWSVFAIEAWAPSPTETIPMTAATPTMIPRIVRNARILLAAVATIAVRSVS